MRRYMYGCVFPSRSTVHPTPTTTYPGTERLREDTTIWRKGDMDAPTNYPMDVLILTSNRPDELLSLLQGSMISR